MNLDVKIAAVFLSYLLNIDLISDKICSLAIHIMTGWKTILKNNRKKKHIRKQI